MGSPMTLGMLPTTAPSLTTVVESPSADQAATRKRQDGPSRASCPLQAHTSNLRSNKPTTRNQETGPHTPGSTRLTKLASSDRAGPTEW
jgi:hypothetical protein